MQTNQAISLVAVLSNHFSMRIAYFPLLLWLSVSCVAQPSPTDTLTFTSGVRAILQDSKGNYWFGSHREGVGYFNGTTFAYFTTQEGLADNQIRSIQEDENGTIWFGTPHGVSSYDGQTFKSHPVGKNPASPKADTDLYFNAGTQEGIYRYDGQQLNYVAFPTPNVSPTGNTYAVTSFSKGKNNMLWIGTYAGVWGYNGSDFTLINDETTDFAESLHVRSILEDAQGRLWIGNNGIGVLLKEADTITHFPKEQGKLTPSPQAVFAIAEDKDGNIWFGDRDTGAWKYDGTQLTPYTIDTQLTSPMIWCIYKDQQDHLLFGMAAGGVYQFNGKSFSRKF